MARLPQRIVFLFALVVSVAAHSYATLLLFQAGGNMPADGAAATAVRLLAAGMALPVLLPLMAFDPDGERLPQWFRLASVPLNSLVWCLGILGVVLLVRRRLRRRSRRRSRGFEVAPVERAHDAERAALGAARGPMPDD